MRKTLEYLKKLDKNNNRIWFQENKALYEQSYAEMIKFTEDVTNELSSYDYLEPISPKKSLFRIYRDVRFGKDKTPYKTHWGGFFKREGSENRGGYYYQVGPKGSYVIGGFFGPNKEDLLLIRKHLAQDSSELRKLIKSKPFRTLFDTLKGSQLKTAPRGFDKDHPDVDLLRYKQFMLRHDFTSEEVHSTDFPKIVAKAFNQMRPFFNYMSEILTTDLNGRSLL
jgi:uncharacterized protein (TIGR02453 family)